jgi:hypothetical protein
MAWLSIPILVWGTGFWLAGGQAASAAAVLDRFEAAWPDLRSGSLPASLVADPSVNATARAALATLDAACRSDGTDDCDDPATLLRNLRISITDEAAGTATAVAQLVAFERQPTTVLWFIAGTELVPVPRQTVLTLALRAEPAPLPGGIDVGARRWRIVSARPGS